MEDLGLAPDPEVVAGLERASQILGRVPEPRADAAGLVAKLQLQIKIALAVGPELLVGDQKHLVDRIAMGQLVHVAAAHAFQSFPFIPGSEGLSRQSVRHDSTPRRLGTPRVSHDLDVALPVQALRP